jgi:AraC-like DNA-binding protein
MKNTDGKKRQRADRRTHMANDHLGVPNGSSKDSFSLVSLVEPQINAEGIHVWPFDPSCPVDVQFLTLGGSRNVRMNRHEYFEVLYLFEGFADCHIQDRLLPFREGDLAIIGSTLYHRLECRSTTPATVAALFFDPNFIRCDGDRDSLEYLAPFLRQDSSFPHITSTQTGIPKQVLELMLRIRSELPASSARSRLTVKTYLKMLLILLVNQYASYSGTIDTFYRQQRALERLHPLFIYIRENCGAAIQVREAARICHMSESHFMSFFKQVTGLTFTKYLNRYRVERSQALLAKSDAPIASISQQVGFCDQSYFGMVFHKIVGLTPADYRRASQGKGDEYRGQTDHTPPIELSKTALVAPPRQSNPKADRQIAKLIRMEARRA